MRPSIVDLAIVSRRRWTQHVAFQKTVGHEAIYLCHLAARIIESGRCVAKVALIAYKRHHRMNVVLTFLPLS